MSSLHLDRSDDNSVSTTLYWIDRKNPELLPYASFLATRLSPEEQRCVAEMRHPDVKERFIFSRSVLRLLLASILGCDVDSRNLFTDPCFGSPLTQTTFSGEPVSFSVSHSKQWSCIATVVAPCDSAPVLVGVDIEARRQIRQPEATAEFAFSDAELTALLGLEEPERSGYFLRLWTRKEAVVKCVRGTVARDMDRFSVPLDTAPGPWEIEANFAGALPVLMLLDFSAHGDVIGTICRSTPAKSMPIVVIDGDTIANLIDGMRA